MKTLAKAAPLPVLIVLHREQSAPGRVGQLLLQRGYSLDIRRPPLDDPLPDTLAKHSGAIVFGGPMSANDNTDWVKREIEWIGVPLREDVPFLGICLGAQMMVRHLGGRVMARDDGRVEIGYWPIYPTRPGRKLGVWPTHVYQWHSEGFDTVEGMELLATGEQFCHQAIRYGRQAYGVQFHPEVSYQTMQRWGRAAEHKLSQPGAQSLAEQQLNGQRYDREGIAWLSAFLDMWLRPNDRKND
ncbi:glutamine amidotransferase [Serratia fonticola]|uniref:glutamine amidotransferase n=1 Tax=Serratia fonticola TaxID=47917 RepID=UPI002DBEC1D1|nr:glutamine amidotransferase [Serratia fonticola]MEB7884383.1 glutamine amidotransferase [Serratia fonticola]